MDKITVELLVYNIRDGYINIPSRKKDGYPKASTPVEIEITNFKTIKSKFYVEQKGSHHGFSKGLRPWFRLKNIRPSDKVRISTIKPMKKYRLEIIK